MAKQEKLTDRQVQLLPAYREKWLKIGLSCEPLDFEKAKDAAKRAYAIAGLAAPTRFYHMSSPIGAAILGTALKNIVGQVGDQVRGRVGAQVWDQVRGRVGARVWDQVWSQVRDQVRDQVWDQVGAQVWDQVMDQVGDQVRNQVWDQVRNQVWNQVRNRVWDQVGDQVYGSHDAGWLGFYDFFGAECGIEAIEKLRPLMDLAAVCGWWAPYEHAVIFQDRHNILRRDDQHRLHCETGPAISYPDGYSLYFWHGTSVPERWITHKDMSPSDILTHKNVEQRRAGCEILGWDRILDELEAKTLDVNPNPQIGTLLEVDLPDSGKERFIRVKCGTGRFFALPVPPEIRTALEAQQWMWNDPNYQPEVRT